MSKREAFKTLLNYMRRDWAFFLLAALSAVGVVAGQLLCPYFAGRAVDCILGEGSVLWDELARHLTAIGISAAAAMVFWWLLAVTGNRIAYRLLSALRKDAFKKVARLPLKYIDNRPYGDLVGVIVSDAETASDGILLAFNQLFTGILTIFGVLGIMLAVRWEIALAVFCITPVSFFAARFIARRTFAAAKRQTEARADETAFADEMLQNLKVVKAFLREEKNAEIFEEKNETLRKASLKATFFSSTVNPTTRFINALVYAAVVLIGGIYVLLTADMGTPFTVGSLTMFLQYANQYTKPFNEISEVAAEFQSALASAGRVFSFLAEGEEVSDRDNFVLPAAEGRVEAADASFSYTDRPFIENFDLKVEPGMRVAIVGPTGCGKTTLIGLLMRFYDVTGGAIYLDGHDIRTVTRASLRANFGMVLQETWLKTATVRENLCMGREDCSEEEMFAAARAAKADAFIRRLPKGYDTVLGEEGTLSEGQRQLLCIARVMLCHPPMLILDEATSNIDTRTEVLVQEAFAELMKGRTCFIVAHRLSTVRSADLILVMDRGSIVEQGTHEELLARGGFYASLYRAQFSRE